MNDLDSIVFVIEDDASLRLSITSLLRSVGYAVMDFESTRAFQQADRPDVPACLVLDVRLPGKSGLEFQRELGHIANAPPIIFITGHGDVPMSVAAMKAGAIEFLTKPFRDQDLLDGIYRAIELDRERRWKVAKSLELRKLAATMTAREREILPLIASGKMNKQIAHTLQLSEVTVKAHRAQLMQKLGATSLADLVRLADRIVAAELEGDGENTRV